MAKTATKIFLVVGAIVVGCAIFLVAVPGLFDLDRGETRTRRRSVYISPEETFSVQLPEGVTLELLRVGAATDPFLTGSFYAGGDERVVFTVGVYDIRKNAREEASLEVMIREHTASAGVTLTSLGLAERSGLPVSRGVGRLLSDGQWVTWVEEARIHGDRAFLLIAVAVHPEEDPDVEAFFESFTPLAAPMESSRPAETPVTTGETTTALSIATDGRHAINGESFRLPCQRRLLEGMIGRSSREWVGEEYGNTIHTWDDLGITTYEKTGTGIVTSVVIDLLPRKYNFSPKRAYSGSLTVDGITVTAAMTPVDVNAGLSGHQFSRILLHVWSCKRKGFATTLGTEPNGAIAYVGADVRNEP